MESGLSPRRSYANTDKNKLYFEKFGHISGNTFGIAYGYIDEMRGEEDMLVGPIVERKRMFKEEMEMFVDAMKDEDPPIDPNISKIILAYFRKGSRFDWTDIRQSDKFYRQTCSAEVRIQRRLEKLKAIKLSSEIT
jgi:hypothetical protein